MTLMKNTLMLISVSVSSIYYLTNRILFIPKIVSYTFDVNFVNSAIVKQVQNIEYYSIYSLITHTVDVKIS